MRRRRATAVAVPSGVAVPGEPERTCRRRRGPGHQGTAIDLQIPLQIHHAVLAPSHPLIILILPGPHCERGVLLADICGLSKLSKVGAVVCGCSSLHGLIMSPIDQSISRQDMQFIIPPIVITLAHGACVPHPELLIAVICATSSYEAILLYILPSHSRRTRYVLPCLILR